MIVGFRFALTSLSATIEMGKESDAGMGTEIDFSGEGSDSNVDPVVVGGGNFLD